MSNLTRNTITSMEVAEMVGKEHSKLLRDIRNYVSQLAEAKIGLGDFFTEATYKDANNQNRPCFQVTKKGCEFIAHKLTGQKGTEFTARYINRFHEMEDGKLPCPLNPIIASSVAELGRVTDRIMTKQGSAPYKIAEAFKRECEQLRERSESFQSLSQLICGLIIRHTGSIILEVLRICSWKHKSRLGKREQKTTKKMQ